MELKMKNQSKNQPLKNRSLTHWLVTMSLLSLPVSLSWAQSNDKKAKESATDSNKNIGQPRTTNTPWCKIEPTPKIAVSLSI